ncbi:MAG: Holliday junction branch migration protein RuvA [Chloroflexota bacterium]
MIASLEGRLESLGEAWAVINVGGIGFQVHMPTSTLSALGPVGSGVKLHTHLHLREDNVTLYGFASPEELLLFQTFTSVSGLGPKLALSMLSSMSPEHLVTAIATGNADLLTTIPGIGKKVASRIILELKEKIGAGWIATPATPLDQENIDVLAALTSLGYSTAEAAKAVATLPPASKKLNLEEKIKLALQYLGSK